MKKEIISKIISILIKVFKSLGIILLYFLFNFISSYFLIKNKYLYAIITDLILLLIFFLIFHKTFINDIKNYNKTLFTKSIKYWLIALFIMYASNIIISLFVNDIATNEEINRSIIKNNLWYSLPTMCILGPIIEEVTFRLSFKKLFNKKIVYATISAILFGLIHLISSSSLIELLYFIPYGSFGFIIAYAYFETNNFYVPITIHIVHNTFAILTILII